MKGTLGWLQKGPDAKQDEAKVNRHLGKFADCGIRCFDFTRSYYADDFRLLGYPATMP